MHRDPEKGQGGRHAGLVSDGGSGYGRGLQEDGSSGSEAAVPSELHARDGSLIRNAATWHPDKVKLLKTTSLSAESSEKRVSTEQAPSGTEVKLLGIDREQLFVEFKGVVQKIPAAATDLAEQMAAVYKTP